MAGSGRRRPAGSAGGSTIGEGVSPRPREFDEEQVLDAAVGCFWRNGLDATSVRDLTHEMGINGPSLYNAFGDKRALFSRALERYVAVRMRPSIEAAERQPSARAALAAFFSRVALRPAPDSDGRGCLVINAAVAVDPDDPQLAPQIAGYLAEIEGFFRRQLERHRREANAASAAFPDPQAGAKLLLTTFVGLRALARTRPDRKAHASLLDAVLNSVAPIPHPRTGS